MRKRSLTHLMALVLFTLAFCSILIKQLRRKKKKKERNLWKIQKPTGSQGEPQNGGISSCPSFAWVYFSIFSPDPGSYISRSKELPLYWHWAARAQQWGWGCIPLACRAAQSCYWVCVHMATAAVLQEFHFHGAPGIFTALTSSLFHREIKKLKSTGRVNAVQNTECHSTG